MPRRVHLLVEGQTEETVVREVVGPYLSNHGLWVTHSILVTRRPAGGVWSRGGVASWAKVHGDVRRLLGDSSIDLLTTMIDYYGFPSDGPGMADRPAAGPTDRVRHVEAAVEEAIGSHRFVPHLVLHELEAWVFAAADELADLLGEPHLAELLEKQAEEAGGPEMVDDGPDSAPSKRLLRACSAYLKTTDGPIAIGALGIESLRRRCPHMDDWLTRLGVPSDR